MVKNGDLLGEFEKQWQSSHPVDYQKNRKIFDSLWQEAIHLGIIPFQKPLEGIETDIELARILNSCSKNS